MNKLFLLIITMLCSLTLSASTFSQAEKAPQSVEELSNQLRAQNVPEDEIQNCISDYESICAALKNVQDKKNEAAKESAEMERKTREEDKKLADDTRAFFAKTKEEFKSNPCLFERFRRLYQNILRDKFNFSDFFPEAMDADTTNKPTTQDYETLGVPYNAEEAAIKQAYKKLARIHHPDKGGDAEKFKALSAAYIKIEANKFRKLSASAAPAQQNQPEQTPPAANSAQNNPPARAPQAEVVEQPEDTDTSVSPVERIFGGNRRQPAPSYLKKTDWQSLAKITLLTSAFIALHHNKDIQNLADRLCTKIKLSELRSMIQKYISPTLNNNTTIRTLASAVTAALSTSLVYQSSLCGKITLDNIGFARGAFLSFSTIGIYNLVLYLLTPAKENVAAPAA